MTTTSPEDLENPGRALHVAPSTLRQAFRLALAAAVVYTIFSYGGIRSPDGEVVFRTAEALATNGTFAVSHRIDGLETFGLPTGVDGRYYSLFGPGQSIACVPLVRLGLLLNKTNWYRKLPTLIPISHYIGGGIITFTSNEVPSDPAPDALRFIVSSFNVVVGALCVLFFFLLVKLLTESEFAAICTASMFAFGTLMLPYSGTFFSEPLATLFLLLSTLFLVWNDLDQGITNKQKLFALFSAALFLGMAITVHISAVLFVPPFLVYGTYPFVRSRWSFKPLALSTLTFSLGIAVFLVLLGYYDYVRFGNVFETGRTELATVTYATFVPPWRGLYGLILGGGKGLVWYCPAAVISLFFWRPFHRRFTALSYTILASVVLRFLFVASRSDWHGGFSLGPRLLVLLVPLMILPFGETFASWSKKRDIQSLWLLFGVASACVFEQIYFSLGEVFSFLHIVNWTFIEHGINVFQNDALYLDWDKSPLLFLLDGKRGPFLLRSLPMSNGALCFLCIVAVGAIMSFGYARFLTQTTGRWR